MTSWPEHLEIRPLTAADADVIAEWRYDGAWRIYDPGVLSTDDGYLAVAGRDGGPLVGYCCGGAEARVPGLAEDPAHLDVGVGMDPRWVGRGHGSTFGATVLTFLRKQADGRGLRAVVQTWNHRSLRLTARLGFTPSGTHTCIQDGRPVEYTVVTLA